MFFFCSSVIRSDLPLVSCPSLPHALQIKSILGLCFSSHGKGATLFSCLHFPVFIIPLFHDYIHVSLVIVNILPELLVYLQHALLMCEAAIYTMPEVTSWWQPCGGPSAPSSLSTPAQWSHWEHLQCNVTGNSEDITGTI